MLRTAELRVSVLKIMPLCGLYIRLHTEVFSTNIFRPIYVKYSQLGPFLIICYVTNLIIFLAIFMSIRKNIKYDKHDNIYLSSMI